MSEPEQAAELCRLLHRIRAQHVGRKGTAVDYQSLRQGPLWRALEQGLARLANLEPTRWPKQVQRAFWINLYNVLVLHAVVVHGHPGPNPLRQLWFFGRKRWQIGGHAFSLDDLEHGLLRGNRRHPLYPLPPFGPGDPRRAWVLPLDPRLHFALNCGARSCPPIAVYEAHRLEAQLELASRGYLQAEVEPRPPRLYLPQLLRWYQADFGGRSGVASLLSQHLGQEPSHWLAQRWQYKPYNWAINALDLPS